MAKVLKACEVISVALLAVTVLLMTAVAFTRYTLGITPVWTEPVLAILVLASVCFAMAPGLSQGVHIAITFAKDRVGERGRRGLQKVSWCLGVGLGVVLAISGFRYARDQYAIGLTDYAGIPQWIPASLAVLFGIVLLLCSLAALLGKSDA
jgi:TRAP-type C4-dicarboxylate transport system permease small subunit